MIVFVNKRNTEPFYTVALATNYHCRNPRIAYYDPRNDCIRIEKILQKSNNYERRAFYTIGKQKDGFAAQGKWTGYPQIVRNIRRRFADKTKFDAETTRTARELYRTTDFKERYEISDQTSADDLLSTAGYFHDSYLCSVTDIENGKRLLFDSTWGFLIELDCRDVDADWADACSTELFFDAEIALKDGDVRLILEKGYIKSEDESPSVTITCKHMQWKFAIDGRTDRKAPLIVSREES